MPTPLHRAPQHRPWAVWLVVLIAVLGVLAPTLTHALMSARGQVAQGFEICTDQGSRWVSVDTSLAATDADAVPAPPSAGASEHCQFCLQTTDRSALPSDPLPSPFLVQDGQRALAVWQALLYPPSHGFAPPPRGPPGFF